MDKESSVILRIKNKIFSIIYRHKEKNSEPGVTEEKEQPVDSEPSSRSENKTETLSPDKKELIELKTELGGSIDTILNKLFDGISGLLEKEYKDRLEGLEKSIKELKKKGEEELVSHLKAYKGELDEVRNLAKTAKLISEENIGKNAKITIEESEIEESKGKIEKIGETKLPDVLRDESKGTTIVSNYTKQAPEGVLKTIRNLEESEILEFKNKLEKIRDMKLSDISDDKLNGITTVLDYIKQAPEIRKMGKSGVEKWEEKIGTIGEMGLADIPDDKLKRAWLVTSIASLLPERDKEVPKPKDESLLLIDVLARLQKRMDEIDAQLLYGEGVKLLKVGAFRSAYECFEEITNLNEDLKGAWLNRGVALGELGEFDEEIKCYNKAKALSKDKNYGKATHNIKIAEGKKRKMYLFSMDVKSEEELNNSSFPKRLRNMFEVKGIILSKNPENILITKESDAKWEITDMEKSYTAIREDGKLNVYRKITKDIR
jgi:tetratricopeptide (TPR) repeat protein